MRILLAVVALASIVGCAQGNDPLSSTSSKQAPTATKPATAIGRIQLARHLILAGVVQPVDVNAQTKQAAIVKIADVVDAAAQNSFDAATAGQSYDAQAAENAAVALANEAADVQLHAQDIVAAGGCGSGDDTGGVTQDDIDTAVSDAANAATAAGEVSDALNPPSTTECSQVCGCEGCTQECSEQPGQVDQGELDQGVTDANNAGAALSDAGATLEVG